jgi:hypothetical protein
MKGQPRLAKFQSHYHFSNDFTIVPEMGCPMDAENKKLISHSPFPTLPPPPTTDPSENHNRINFAAKPQGEINNDAIGPERF